MKKLLIAMIMLGAIAMVSDDARADEPVKIAFVDTGNTGRSVTAEGLANAAIQAQKLHVAVISRAVDMDPYTLVPEANFVTLLAPRGIDTSGHRAAQLTANDVKHSDVILTMTAKHKATIVDQFPDAKAKTFTLAEYATGQASDVVDAYGKPMNVYEQVLTQIDQYLPAALAKALTKGAPG